MSALRMLTTPFLAGPRDGLASRAEWIVALTVSGGYENPPPAADALESWTEALMPWSTVFGGAVQFVGIVFHKDGSRELTGPLTAFTTSDADEITPSAFVSSTRRAFIDRHMPAAGAKLHYDLVWDSSPATRRITAEINAERITDDGLALPFAPILQSLATLPPALAQAVGALRYVRLPRKALGKEDSSGVWEWAKGVSLFPAEIADRRTGASLGTIVADDVSDFVDLGGDLYQATYRSAPVEGYSRMLAVDSLASAVPGPYSGDYWLPVTDATRDALRDVDSVVTRLCHPAYHFERTAVGDLQSILRIVESGNARMATADEVLQFAEFVRAWLADDAVRIGELTASSTARAFLKLSETPPSGDVANVLRAALANEGVEFWNVIAKGATASGRRQAGEGALSFLIEGSDEGVSGRVEAELKGRNAKPGLPGEGVPFCVGDPAHRLVHETNASLADTDAGMEEVAGVAVLARRVDATQSAGPWRLLTAGVPAINLAGRPFDREEGSKDDVSWLPAILPAPLTVAFVNGVLRNDYEYRGAPMRNVAPLDSTHGFSGANVLEDETLELGASVDLSFHSPAGLPGVDPTEAGRVSAPLLRYGDAYDVAAFVVDRAGGYPVTLSHGPGVGFNLVALDGITPPKQTRIPFRRTIPVGAVNISPMDPRITDSKVKRDWPAIPEGVVLRGLELLQARRVRERLAEGDLANGDVPAC